MGGRVGNEVTGTAQPLAVGTSLAGGVRGCGRSTGK
jgi:hypothetical protein